MEVRGTDMGRLPMLKFVEFLSVPGREGLHLLGQSLRSVFHFLLLFLDFYLHACTHIPTHSHAAVSKDLFSTLVHEAGNTKEDGQKQLMVRCKRTVV